MMTPQEIHEFREKNKRWLSGQSVEGLRFLHDSIVAARLPTGEMKIGWIVSAWFEGGEAIYTVEAEDGSGDYHCKEDMIECIRTCNGRTRR